MKPTSLFGRLGKADFADALGVAVPRGGVSVSHLRKRFRSVNVVALISNELPADAESATVQAARIVKDFAASRGLEGAGLGVALDRDDCFIGQLQLPATAADNVAQVVSYELDRVMPVTPESVYTDAYYRPLGETGERLAVTVVAAYKERVDRLYDALATVGLAPMTVVAQPVAINDYYYFCKQGEAGLAGIFHAHGDRSALTLSCDGFMVSSLNVAGRAKNYTEALRREIERSAPDWADEPADVLVDIGPAFGAIAPDGFLPEGQDPDWRDCMAIGAALARLGESRCRVNLLPDALVRPEEGVGMREMSLGALVLLMSGLLAASITVKNLGVRNAIADELARLKPLVAKVTSEERANEEIMAKLKTLESQRSRRVLPYLREVTSLVPESAYLTTFRYKGGRIEVDGIASNASGLISILERSNYFKDVQFTAPTTKYLASQERFSLRMELEK